MHRTAAAVQQIREGTDVESVHLLTDTLKLKTEQRKELYNITDSVAEAISRHAIHEGLVIVSSMHTTLGLFVNEWQQALLHDIKQMLDRVIVPGQGYRHDDPAYSDCDRRNAHAHLQAALLGHTLTFPIHKGRLVLGQFQAIIAAELDGPRSRSIAIQIIGR
jgi:secondary thiamine-phosphate synthase enzyme